MRIDVLFDTGAALNLAVFLLAAVHSFANSMLQIFQFVNYLERIDSCKLCADIKRCTVLHAEEIASIFLVDLFMLTEYSFTQQYIIHLSIVFKCSSEQEPLHVDT